MIDCQAYVYLWKGHPLANEESISFEQLGKYPCLAFEQGDDSAFYLAEEILSTNEYPQIIKANDLEFETLFTAKPHIFVSTSNPLAGKESVTMEDLKAYPYLSFEQGEHNSFYFSEEIFSTTERAKNIRVRDRATLFNLLIGLNGYTVCSGVIDEELNGANIVAVPLKEEGDMEIGILTHHRIRGSRMSEFYIQALRKYISWKNAEAFLI